MKRRGRSAAVALLLALCAVLALWLAGRPITLVLTQEQMQREIDARLPLVSGAFAFAPVSIQLSQGRIAVNAKVEATAAGQRITFDATAVGALRYDPWTLSLFFSADAITIGEVSLASGAAGSGLRERLARQVIADPGLILATTERALRAVLDRVPVYRVGGDVRENVLGSALESIEVTETGVVLRLSLWQLTLSVLFGLACLAIAVTWVGSILALSIFAN